MTQVAVTGLMALLTVVQFITVRHRRSQRILYASALITLAMFLNIDGVYLAVDHMLGGGTTSPPSSRMAHSSRARTSSRRLPSSPSVACRIARADGRSGCSSLRDA